MRTLQLMIFFAPICGSLAVAGCKPADVPASAPSGTVSASAVPDARPGIAVSGVRIALPPVAGNPAALYFSLANAASAPARLVAVDVAGADKAEMHQTAGGAMKSLPSVDLAPGASVSFAPGGKHVMVYGLAKATKPGDALEVRLTFSDGHKISTKAAVQAAGSSAATAGAMGGMKM
jgi:periplasmic copper chaperone A